MTPRPPSRPGRARAESTIRPVPSNPPVFDHYSQAELDAQYDNRAKVPAFQAWLDRFRDDSAAVRAHWGDRARLDVAVGPSAIEKVDVFPVLAERGQSAPRPADPGSSSGAGRQGVPVMVFIHGGYWLLLDKALFSFVARGLAAHGIATVVIGYAKVPQVRIEEIVRQCRQAVCWAVDNATAFGGDPDRVGVCGFSAGGHLAAMVGAEGWQPGRPLIAGYALSGLHDLEPIRRSYLQKDLQLTDEDVARFSPMKLAPPDSGHWLAMVGGDEGPEYLRQSSGLAAAWQTAGSRSVAFQAASGHDHFSLVMTLADPADPITRLIATDFLGRCR